MFLIRYKMCKICLCMVELSSELQVFIISLMLIECQCHWITLLQHKSPLSQIRIFTIKMFFRLLHNSQQTSGSVKVSFL